jgi:hypothetical protein
MTMSLIETKTLGTAAASIEFTSIPQDGTDLFLFISGRSNRAGNISDYIAITFNSNTSNYSARFLQGDGSAATSETDVSAGAARIVGQATGASATSDTFANNSVYVPNYTQSVAKSYSSDVVTENNATAARQVIIAGLWNDTSAITSLKLEPLSGGANNFVTGTTISLYKITKGSDGIVTTS